MPAPAALEIDAQYRQAREDCALVERPGRGLIRVAGPDAAEYLQGQLTNDIETLEPGEGCRAELLDRKGHIQADLRVLRPAAGEIWIDTDAAAGPTALRHLTMYSIGRDVTVTDASGERAVLSLLGARSEEIAGTPRGPRHSCAEARIGRTDLLAVTTRDGFDLFCPLGELAEVREELIGSGAGEVSEEAAEILRIEAGEPRFGTELGPQTMPAEAGIVEETVSFTKGCYIGQETVARLHYRGRPNRHLRGLRLDATASPGDEVRLGEKAVGTVGSACLSPAFGHIALAILRREAEPGAAVTVAGAPATVVDLPFAVEAP